MESNNKKFIITTGAEYLLEQHDNLFDSVCETYIPVRNYYFLPAGSEFVYNANSTKIEKDSVLITFYDHIVNGKDTFMITSDETLTTIVKLRWQQRQKLKEKKECPVCGDAE